MREGRGEKTTWTTKNANNIFTERERQSEVTATVAMAMKKRNYCVGNKCSQPATFICYSREMQTIHCHPKFICRPPHPKPFQSTRLHSTSSSIQLPLRESANRTSKSSLNKAGKGDTKKIHIILHILIQITRADVMLNGLSIASWLIAKFANKTITIENTYKLTKVTVLNVS